MEREIRVSDIRESIRREGRFIGYPTTEVVMSNISRSREYSIMTIKEAASKIYDLNHSHILITGEEPTIQWEDLRHLISELNMGMHSTELDTSGKHEITPELAGMLTQINIIPELLENWKHIYRKVRMMKGYGVGYNFRVGSHLDIATAGDFMHEFRIPYTIATFTPKEREFTSELMKVCLAEKVRFGSVIW